MPPRRSPAQLRALVDQVRKETGLPVTPLYDVLLNYGVPAKYARDAIEQDPATSPGMGLAARLAQGEGRILVLAGRVGRGKSTAAAYGLTFMPGLWVHSPMLAIPQDDENDDGTISDREMRKACLLVIDDLGSEHSPSGYVGNRVNDVLTYREANNMPAIITTNKTAEEFKILYGDRIISRLNGRKEAMGWQVLEGPDLRTLQPRAIRNPQDPREVDHER